MTNKELAPINKKFVHPNSISSMDHHLICPNSLHDKLGCFPPIIKRTNSIDRSDDLDVTGKVKQLNALSEGTQNSLKTFISKFDKCNRPYCAILGASKIHRALCDLESKMHKMLKDIKEISAIKVDKPSKKSQQELPKDNENVIFSGSRASIVEKITDMLLSKKVSKSPSANEKKISQRRTVSIVGPGGCGKTAVAYKVYSSKKIKDHFEKCMWVTISEEFETSDVLKKMLNDIGVEKRKKKDLDDMKSTLRNELEGKKYLLVLDDVWPNTLWYQIVNFLPDSDKGSILLTSRDATIDQETDPETKKYKLPLLNEEESKELLKNSYKEECKRLKKESTGPPDELIAKWALRCDGLPLALKVLGRVLAQKDPDKWEMDWAVDGKDCFDSLERSYENLPPEHKPCFVYLACFPEDYEIDAKVLIQLWIAEEFVDEDDKGFMENSAEQYLNVLAERFMVEVVRRPYDKSVKTVRVLRPLHHLAIHIAKKHNFITFSIKDVKWSENPLKRVALDFTGEDDSEFMKQTPNLLSIHSYGQPDCTDLKLLPNCSGYPNLRVLNVEDVKISDTMEWDRLHNLRFLRVHNKSAIPQSLSSLMDQANHLKNLETLDLRTYDHQLDGYSVKRVWDITTLRYVCFPPGNNVLGPPKKAYLPRLQTLKYVQDKISGLMWNVCYLKLWLRDSSLQKIYPFLKMLDKKLISLRLDVNLNNQKGPRNTFKLEFQSFTYLKNMYLAGVGRNYFDYESSPFPPNLSKLRLSYSNFEQQSMPVLGKLQLLKILIIHAAFTGEKMTCSAGLFPALEELILTNLPNLKELEVQENALPALKLLKMSVCPKLLSEPKNLSCRLQIHKGW